jgi:3-oxosteroid 1-dehydrogenase
MSKATHKADSRLRVSRRGFLKASGVSAVAATAGGLGAVPFAGSAAAQQGWDAEHDIVVVGSGGAAFSAAITARAMGSDVVMFEKGAYVGGTTLVSGGGAWFPNNHLMQQDGHEDQRDAAISYMTRYSLPHLHNPDDPQCGLSDEDYALYTRYYDTSAEAALYLEEQGAITWTYGRGYGPNHDNIQVDYMASLEEDEAPMYRTLHPATPEDEVGYGQVMISGYQAWAEENGIAIHLNHRVDQVITNAEGEVVGVEVTVLDPDAGETTATPGATPAGEQKLAIRARKGVIFGSGGFDRNEDMMRHLMSFPQYGGCAAPTNEGDFLRISSAVGAKLGNLHNAWRTEGLFEQAVADAGAYNCIFVPYGDSYFQVNKTGRRFMNEKRSYQDRPMGHNNWDTNHADWISRLGFTIYDQRTQDFWGGSFPYPKDPSTAPYVIHGDTLEELADAIAERLESLRDSSGDVELDPNFKENLLDEFERFNEFARAGEDLDFKRGSLMYDVEVPNGPMNEENLPGQYPSPDQANPAMYPLRAEGPYYAFITSASTMGTNGGPVINPDAQIVRWDGSPVPGLYGAGNCIANPGVNAYWGGGATLGNGHVWGYNAGRHAHESSEKPVS